MNRDILPTKDALRKALVFALIAGAVLLLDYFMFYRTSQDTTFKSKEGLCTHFAQSYLKTIPSVEPNYSEEKWEKAIDVETDIYNMCMLPLEDEALRNYKPSSLEKY